MVTWLSEISFNELVEEWYALFDTENTQDEKIRHRGRDLLLPFFKPFFTAHSSCSNPLLLAAKWNLYVYNENILKPESGEIEKTLVHFSSIRTTLPPLRILDSRQSSPCFGQSFCENLNTEPTPSFSPYVLCEINLFSSEKEIMEEIRKYKTKIGFPEKADGRPKNSVKLEKYYLDVLIMLQNNVPVARIYEYLLATYNVSLEKRTFEKQIPVLLNFIDPNQIGHKKNKILLT